jgi:hypothetical protein
MKRTYPIREWKAIEQFRSHLSNDPGTIQMVLSLSIVRVACRNVKRWRPGDHLERWVGSGLVVADRQFRRMVGYRALPGLIAVLGRDSETGRAGSSAA